MIELNWKDFLKRLSLFIVICFLIIGAAFGSYYAYRGKYIYKNGDWNYKFVPQYDTSKYNVLFDHHAHTSQSSGVLTPEQNIQYHLAM
jgi:hypothetical protein